MAACLPCLRRVCFSCRALSAAQDAGSGANQKFTVSGTVVNEWHRRTHSASDGDAAGLARRDMPSATATERFTIEGVAAGRYSIQAQKPGFFGPQERGASRSVQGVEVGANSDAVSIKLAAENVIFGRLTEPMASRSSRWDCV